MRSARIGKYPTEPSPGCSMETRLIIAYSLIAMMASLFVLGGLLISRRQGKIRRRNAGKGDY